MQLNTPEFAEVILLKEYMFSWKTAFIIITQSTLFLGV